MSDEISLSIAETNEIRRKLGLPLLPDAESSQTLGAAQKVQLPEEKSAKSDFDKQLEKKRVPEESIREGIARSRRNRESSRKLKGRGLGDDESESDVDDAEKARRWVNEARKRAKADRQEKRLAVVDTTEEVLPSETAGLRVEHDSKRFDEGKDVILTLKDTNVLDDEEDALENVNIAEYSRYERNLKERNKSYYKYKPNDEMDREENSDVILPNFDKEKEDIGMRIELDRPTGVDAAVISVQKMEEVVSIDDKKKNAKDMIKLELQTRFEGDFYSKKELKRFKKRKKGKHGEEEGRKRGQKKRRRAFQVEESPLNTTNSVNIPDIREDSGVTSASSSRMVGNRQELGDRSSLWELQKESRRRADARYDEALRSADSSKDAMFGRNIEGDTESEGFRGKEVIRAIRQEKRGEEELKDQRDNVKDEGLVVSDTFELIKSMNQTERNREEIEVEKDAAVAPHKDPATEVITVETLTKAPENRKSSETEPELAKGQITRDAILGNSVSSVLNALRRKNELRSNEQVDGRRIDVQKEISSRKKEEVQLEYRDKDGRILSKKEAYRQISYVFHGNQPGKGRLGKRWNRIAEQQRRKAMDSTDTPLGAVEALKRVQEATNSPFVVLNTGSRRKAE